MPAKYTPQQRIAAFWNKVDKSGGEDACWLWTGSLSHSGYGKVGWNRKLVGTHRVSWEIANGAIPDGLWVLHNCPNGDNPRCCNPAHLFLGTAKINADDMIQKGRDKKAHGETHFRAKLSDSQVSDIRKRYAAGGILQSELAAEYSINTSTVSKVVNFHKRKGR